MDGTRDPLGRAAGTTNRVVVYLALTLSCRVLLQLWPALPGDRREHHNNSASVGYVVLVVIPTEYGGVVVLVVIPLGFVF